MRRVFWAWFIAMLTMSVFSGCGTNTESAVAQDKCLSLPNEQVNAVAWDPAGDTLAVVSVEVGGDDAAVVRSITWPTLKVAQLDRSLDIRPDTIAAEAGFVAWLRDGGLATEVRRYALRTDAQDALLTTTDSVSGLQLVGDRALVASNAAGDTIQIQMRPPSPGRVLYETDQLVEGFRLSTLGDTLYVMEYEVGVPPTITVVSGVQRRQIPLNTAAASNLSLDEKNERVVYIDQSLARLVSRDASGVGDQIVLVDETVRAGEVSPRGVVAYVPWPDNEVTTPICFRADRD